MINTFLYLSSMCSSYYLLQGIIAFLTPDTESLLRHIRITRDYLHKVWGIAPDSVKVDFSPDTFGHSRFVPEINTFGSVPYYYHCRGLQDELTLYRFRAPSGSEVLMYKEPYWYNSGVCPDNGIGVLEMERRCKV